MLLNRYAPQLSTLKHKHTYIRDKPKTRDDYIMYEDTLWGLFFIFCRAETLFTAFYNRQRRNATSTSPM